MRVRSRLREERSRTQTQCVVCVILNVRNIMTDLFVDVSRSVADVEVWLLCFMREDRAVPGGFSHHIVMNRC